MKNTTITYLKTNSKSTSTVRLDANGDLIDREEYYPFGDSSLRTTSYKRYRYVSKELDSESGLYYYGARYYSTWTCRFISVDPLADKYAHLNPYNYASNKPINGLDIDGMQDEDEPQSGNTGETSNQFLEIPSIPGSGVNSTFYQMYTVPLLEQNNVLGLEKKKSDSGITIPPSSFTYTLDYEVNSSNIPFMESYRSASGTFTNVLETGEISGFIENDADSGFNIILRVPKIYPHNLNNPTYTTYIGTGSDLDSITWEKEESLGQAFIDGFNVGWKVGLSTAIQEALSTAILFKRFNLSKPETFKRADPELLRTFFEKKGWKINPTTNKGFKAINPENSNDVFHIIRGNASKVKPGSNIPKIKQGDYLKRPSDKLWPKRIPLKNNPKFN